MTQHFNVAVSEGYIVGTCAYDAYPNSFSVLAVMAPKLGACCAAFVCTLRRQARASDAADGVAAAAGKSGFTYPVSA